MAKKEGGGRGCWKWGCIGCGGLLVVVMIILAIIAGVARNQVNSQQVKEETLTHEMPSWPSAEGTPDTGEVADPDAAEMRTETVELGRPGQGRVVLDLRQGGFFILPAGPGEPLRVEATYDANSYKLVEGFEEGEGGTWTYNLSFQRMGGNMLMSVLGQIFGGEQPEVYVYLPPDAPLELDLTMREGGSQIDLGGLWLTSAEIDFARSGFTFDVSEPLREPMDNLVLTGSMGGANLEGIGNASPRKLDVELKMGGMNLDLRGQWLQDADIHIEWDMGGANVMLPHNATIHGIEGHEDSGPGGEVQLPKLSFRLTGKMDDIEFQRPRRR